MSWTCRYLSGDFPLLLIVLIPYRHVSDYDVSLVNGSNQEFYVHFYGPAESKYNLLSYGID